MKISSLKLRYIGGLCGVILAVSVALLLYMRLQFNKQLKNELHKRGSSIARNLAEAAIKPIITENHVALQLIINDIMRNEEDIRYIYIISSQQQIIAHSFGTSFPLDLLKLDKPDMKHGPPIVQAFQAEQEPLEDVSATIQQGDFGRVHVGISEELLKSELRDGIRHSAPIVALILLMGGAAAWWVSSKITRPIIALSNNAKMVSEGRLDGVIEVTSRDEIGDLTATFNVMTAELRRRTEEQEQAEHELRLQTILLEDEVAKRQVTQEELAVKQCQLEALNLSLEGRINTALADLRIKDRVMLAQGRQAAMGEMINNIAHQWRQPLNNLGLIVQNIKVDYDCGTLTPEVLTSDVDKVMDTIIFMSQTINDFRSFFNPDNVKKIFSIRHGLTKVIAMIEASLSKQGVQLLVEQQEEGVAVDGYFNEYNQVLLNILNNAKDALLEQTGVKPVISISIGSEEGLAVVRVRDNAGGIPDDIIGQVFDPYFTTKEHGKGSGIGLYMSRIIIEEHFAGTLTAENVDGGAQFTISVPEAKNVL